MSSLPGRCAREARILASRNSTAAAQRARSFHSTTSQDEGQKPLKATLVNQSAFNAIKEVSKQPLIRRVAHSGGNGNSPSPRLAVRRPPPAPGASPAQSRPTTQHNDISGSKPTRATRTPPRFAGKRQSGPGGDRAEGSGRPKRAKRGNRKGAESALKDAGGDVKQYSYEDFRSGKPVPHTAQLDDLQVEWLADRAEAIERGTSFVPDVGPSLVGNGATTITSPRDSAELMHRLFGRSASTQQPTNAALPVMKVEQLLHGKTVYFRDEEEARTVQEMIKSMKLRDLAKDVEGRGPEEQLPKRHGFNLSSFEDIKLETVPETERAQVSGAWLAGKYAPPGDRAGAKAGDALRSVWRQTARNTTYLVQDEEAFGKKVASLLPRPAAPTKARA